MSVFKMSVLTFIISFGFAAYAYCNWTSENMRLNDVKDDVVEGIKAEKCSYCGEYYPEGWCCWNANCPGKK